MKQIYFTVLTSIILFSCVKEQRQQKDAVTIHSSKIADVRGSSILTSSDQVQRQIDIVDRQNGAITYSFDLILKTTNINDNLLESLKSGSFTGQFTVKLKNRIIKQLFFENGHKVQAPIRTGINDAGLEDTFIDPSTEEAGCGIGIVHDCVGYKIDQMNFVDYAVCLVTAPECYAQVWASCYWDVCVKGKRYPVRK